MMPMGERGHHYHAWHDDVISTRNVCLVVWLFLVFSYTSKSADGVLGQTDCLNSLVKYHSFLCLSMKDRIDVLQSNICLHGDELVFIQGFFLHIPKNDTATCSGINSFYYRGTMRSSCLRRVNLKFVEKLMSSLKKGLNGRTNSELNSSVIVQDFIQSRLFGLPQYTQLSLDVRCYTKCSKETYWEGCRHQCGIDCPESDCDRETGVCKDCPPGKDRDQCELSCSLGTYGRKCNETCSNNCNGTNGCNIENGACIEGCTPGYIGPLCDQHDDDGSVPVGAIVGPIVGFVLLVLVFIIGVIIWRRRRYRNDVTGPEVETSFDDGYEQVSNSERASNSMTKRLDSYIPAAQEPPVKAKPDLSQGHEYNQSSALESVYYNHVQGLSDTVISVQDLNNSMASHRKEFSQKQFESIPANSNATITVVSRPSSQHNNIYNNISA